MTKKFIGILALLLLSSSCGGKKGFEVSVDAKEIGTQEITVVYAVDNGERVVMRLPAIDGKFEFKGASADTTDVALFNAKKILLGQFRVVNGMNVRIKSTGDSLYIDDSEQPIVKKFDDFVADSLPRFPQEVELVVSHDSVRTFSSEGVWFFSESTMERTKSFKDSIREYEKMSPGSVRDVFVTNDLSQWRLFSRRDSADWVQGIMPDAPVVLKGILTQTPCFMVVDSLGSVSRVQRLP